jgi:hypothetical protein
MLVENLAYISFWDLDGSDVVMDMDFGLTYGDGITLHTAADVLEEVRWEVGAGRLVKSLNEVLEKFGEGFLLAF